MPESIACFGNDFLVFKSPIQCTIMVHHELDLIATRFPTSMEVLVTNRAISFTVCLGGDRALLGDHLGWFVQGSRLLASVGRGAGLVLLMAQFANRTPVNI